MISIMTFFILLQKEQIEGEDELELLRSASHCAQGAWTWIQPNKYVPSLRRDASKKEVVTITSNVEIRVEVEQSAVKIGTASAKSRAANTFVSTLMHLEKNQETAQETSQETTQETDQETAQETSQETAQETDQDQEIQEFWKDCDNWVRSSTSFTVSLFFAPLSCSKGTGRRETWERDCIAAWLTLLLGFYP